MPTEKSDILLIAALGNKGEKYSKTRHNIGFMFGDVIQKKFQFYDFQYCYKIQGYISLGNILEKKVVILKPDTYMNRSGIAVASAIKMFNINYNNIIVVHDDVDISFGSQRLKIKGGSGGHNGIKSIENEIGTDCFIRIRLGIGKPMTQQVKLERYVLMNFLDGEMELIDNLLSSRWSEIICKVIDKGVAEAMNIFNRRSG